MARRRPYDQRPRRDLTTWDTRTASPAVRTGHRLTQRHRPHHLCPSRADRAYTESFSAAAITWFPITRGWPYTAPSSSACPDHCRRRHLRGDTGPRVVVMVGRPIGRTDTDQKVGGSNPSGRALQIRCTAAVSAVSGDLGTRSHPINRPIEFGRGPLTHCDSVGVSIVVRTVALMRDARGGGSLPQRRPGVFGGAGRGGPGTGQRPFAVPVIERAR